MTEIFAVYLQASRSPSQSLEYALECSPGVDLVAFLM